MFMSAQLGVVVEVRLLGPVELRDRGGTVALGTPRQRCVLALLAMTPGRAVPMDKLVERVWNGRPPGEPRKVLYTYVSRIRNALRLGEGPDRPDVRRAGGGYVLDIEPDRVDLHRARRLASEGRACAGAERAALERRARLLRGAFAVVRLTPLAGLTGAWVDRTRAGIEQERLAVATELFDAELRLGRHSAVLGELAELVAEQPLAEPVAGLLMLALYRSGRQADSLSVYAQIRQRLVAEIGDEPGSDLRRLHEQILKRELEVPGPTGGGLLVPATGQTGPDPTAGPAGGPEHPVPRVGAVELVERDTQLADLSAALRGAGAGRGAVVLVTGEAGAGKTALVRKFASGSAQVARILWGTCDELVTPRPLGPFRDIARQLGLEPSNSVIEALVVAFEGTPGPTVAIVEDAHWADEASLDAIRTLGRRVSRMALLLVVTFRDDEIPPDHPLRRAIGTVPPDDLRRIPLPPLSRRGVAQLAGTGDVTGIYRLTGGNPYFVTEVLAAPQPTVPLNVRDAVMARVGRLGSAGRACVEIAAVVPGDLQEWFLEACGAADGLEEALRIGVLHTDGPTICFRHELSRRTVEQSLTLVRRRRHNRRVLDVLAGTGADPAILAHLAVESGDAAQVARFAPVAARAAAVLDSHREAAAHFQRALAHPRHHPLGELAALWFDYAHECYTIGDHERAEAAARRAVECFTETGDRAASGRALRLLSDVLWFLRRGGESTRTAVSAIAVLEQLPAGPELAWAYAQRAKLAMVDRRTDQAVEDGQRAIALARQVGATEVLIHAMNTVGMARWTTGRCDNTPLRDSLELALASGLNGHAGRAYANLAVGHLAHMQYEQAGSYLEAGLAWCEAHDLLTTLYWLLAERSEWHLEQGSWAEAEQDAEQVLAIEDRSVTAQVVLGLLQSRRGSPSASVTIEQARRLADRGGDTQDLLTVGLARLEAAWLRGCLSELSPLAREMFALARRAGSGRSIGEAALWLYRAGIARQPPPGAAEPYLLQLTGQWREAAEAWDSIGRPYARADALSDAPEPHPLLEALELLDHLGAEPQAAIVRRRLAKMR
jgi:DNA-binding SARP family transcriptional activator/tetratricopeptide (TPR) repeat protein